MNKLVTERVDKCNIIIALCASNPTIVDSLPAFKSAVNYLSTETAAIKKQMQPLLLPGTGTAAAKQAAKLKAATLLDPICGALMGYADAIKNPELGYAANFTVNSILKIRDEEMAQTCYALLDLATANIAALKDYGYTDADIQEASDAVAEFEAYNPKPIENRSEDKAERGTLLEHSWVINAFVGRQLKNTAKRFKITEPEFHAKLMNAMRNQKRGIRHKLSDEELALRKAKREAKAAAKVAAKEAKEAEAQARNAEIQAQLDAMTNNVNAESLQNGTPPPAEQNGSPA